MSKRSNSHVEDTQRLVTEIEMLKVILYFGKKKALATAAGVGRRITKRRPLILEYNICTCIPAS